MSVFQAVVLALVQAATEFLPISSSAHLVLVPWLLGWPDQGLLFDVALHFGTVLAVLSYFARSWVRLLFLSFGRKVLPPEPGDPDEDIYEHPRLFLFLVAATFPAGIAGLLLEDYVETTFRSPYVIGVMLVAIAGVLWWADRRGKLAHDLSKVSFGEAMAVGFAQAMALIPGTSRSGITISVALLLGMKRSAAARFSFLLSTPIVVGASAKKAYDVWEQGGVPPEMYLPFLVGVSVSALAGYAVIAFFLRYLQSRTLQPFVYYRLVFGIMVLALAVFFRFPAGGI